jgi:hypothetical protein
MNFVEPVTLAASGVELVPLALDHENGLRAGEWPEVKARLLHLLDKPRH